MKEKKPVVKQPYRNNVMQTGGVDGLEEGDNTKYLSVNLKLFAMEKIDIRDADAVQQRIGEYFTIYAEADLKPTVAGLAMALGIDRRRLWEIKAGVQHTSPPKVSDSVRDWIKKAYDILENMWEIYMGNGKINPVSGIFLGKNNFGYQDKTEYVVTPNQQKERDFDPEATRRKYLMESSDSDPSDSDPSDSGSEA